MRINRRKHPEQPLSAPERDERVPVLQQTVRRLAALVKGRTVPTDRQIDALSEITDEDIASAVDAWDGAQKGAGTGLDGLLAARVRE